MQSKRLTRGLGRFVKQIVNMYKSGFDSRRMLLQQSLAGVQGGEPGDQGGESPSVITMQQNTRLVVLTLEVSEPPNLCTANIKCFVPCFDSWQPRCITILHTHLQACSSFICTSYIQTCSSIYVFADCFARSSCCFSHNFVVSCSYFSHCSFTLFMALSCTICEAASACKVAVHDLLTDIAIQKSKGRC